MHYQNLEAVRVGLPKFQERLVGTDYDCIKDIIQKHVMGILRMKIVCHCLTQDAFS
jgi:hypothetical protein